MRAVDEQAFDTGYGTQQYQDGNMLNGQKMKANSDSDFESKFEEGENIEEEGEHFNEHTLSFIKCKPSLL
jgi:hypothetical protein